MLSDDADAVVVMLLSPVIGKSGNLIMCFGRARLRKWAGQRLWPTDRQGRSCRWCPPGHSLRHVSPGQSPFPRSGRHAEHGKRWRYHWSTACPVAQVRAMVPHRLAGAGKVRVIDRRPRLPEPNATRKRSCVGPSDRQLLEIAGDGIL